MIGLSLGITRLSGVATAAPGGFDPSTLTLTSWVRNYAGSPWAGTASAGTSATPTLSSGAAPGVGTLNSQGVADFDGSGDNLVSSVTTASLFTAPAGGVAVLFSADTTTAAQAEAYDDRPLVTDENGRLALVHTSSGIRATIYNGAAWVITPSIACATGAYRWAFAWWTGGTLFVQLDGGTPQSVAIGGTGVNLGAGAFKLGENYDTTKDYDGKVADAMTTAAAWTAGNITDLVSYGNSRYGLSL
jgi:hypothetical protein